MKKRNVSILVLMTLFLLLAFLVINDKTSVFDEVFYNMLVRNQFLDKLMKIITNFGSFIFLLIMSIILFLVIKDKRTGLAIPIGVLGIAVINYTIKNIIKRVRPVGIALIDETGYSFPSGHTSSSVVFYGLIMFIVLKYIKDKRKKAIICSLLISIMILIGLSRIYLGVHYATDVLGAMILSSIYLILYTQIIKNAT